jgi:2-dehydropantoate 2-reductase
MDSIIDEIFTVLKAGGIETFWARAEEFKRVFYTELLPPTSAHYPSMLEDIKRGRTEIDSLNGAIVELGRRFGVRTPVNESVTRLVKAKELLFDLHR